MIVSHTPKLLSVVKQVTATWIPPFCETVSQLYAFETLLSRHKKQSNKYSTALKKSQYIITRILIIFMENNIKKG
jgi:hypothetical protein